MTKAQGKEFHGVGAQQPGFTVKMHSYCSKMTLLFHSLMDNEVSGTQLVMNGLSSVKV